MVWQLLTNNLLLPADSIKHLLIDHDSDLTKRLQHQHVGQPLFKFLQNSCIFYVNMNILPPSLNKCTLKYILSQTNNIYDT
jgi:hypothetical protein